MVYKPILVVKEKASEIFESLLCNPDGDIAIVASEHDKKMLKAGIEKVKELEAYKLGGKGKEK